MSYILEALKKAQAERQLGDLPTIHAAQLQPAGPAGAASRKPLWLALALLTLALLALLLWIWRQPAPPVQPAIAASAIAPPPPALPVLAPAPVPVPVSVPVSVPAPVAQKAALAPQTPAPASAPKTALAPARALPVPHQPAAAPAAPAASVAVAADEGVQALNELPEPIRRQIPALSLGGYIYSKNPADRLLLIDKVLRHEGEEVAPGLTLEKLQPKSAVFNFKGYRYRLAY